MSGSDPSLDVWLAQHERTAALISEFYEWRHKILTRYAIVLGALGLAVGWVFRYSQDDGDRRLTLAATLAIAGLASVVAFLMDVATQNVLRRLYEVGRGIESQLAAVGPISALPRAGLITSLASFFDRPPNERWRPSQLNLRDVVRFLYAGVAGLSAVGLVVVLVADRGSSGQADEPGTSLAVPEGAQMTQQSGWTADDWSALGTCATAAIAILALVIAAIQVRESQRLRNEQAQPYIAVAMEPTAASPTFLDLVVRNFGATAAHDIRIAFDPPLTRSNGSGGQEPVWVPEVIPTLVPGQEWRTFWDSGRHRYDFPELHSKHSAVVTFLDSKKRKLDPLTFTLDWGAYLGRRYIDIHGIHDVANSMRDIKKTMRSWNESIRGSLSVYVRDGDREDERRRQERDDFLGRGRAGEANDPSDEDAADDDQSGSDSSQ